MKIAITGLSGVIGTHLVYSLPRRATVIDLYHSCPSARISPHRWESHYFDLSSARQCLLTLRDTKPDIIVHLAAITHIDQCEKFRKERKQGKAWKVNVDAVNSLVQYCEESGARLIYLSTECVFDGKKGMYTEKSVTNPINWYGYTKAVAEERILTSGINTAILRSVVAFDPIIKTKTIYGHFASILNRNEELKVVNDLYFMPTYIGDIQRMLARLLVPNREKIFHIVSPDVLTPYTFALLVAKKIGADKRMVIPVSAKEFFGVRKATKRLKYSTLDSKRTQKILGLSGRSVESILL